MASGSGDGTIKIWESESGVDIKTLRGHSSVITSVSFSPDGNLIASGSLDSTIKLWNVKDGKAFLTFKETTSKVTSVSFSQTSKFLVTGNSDGIIRIWNVKEEKEIKSFAAHKYSIRSISFSSDGKTFASSASNDSKIQLWNFEEKEHLRTLEGVSSGVNSLTFSSDGNALAWASDDNMIKLLNIQNGKSLQSLKGHSSFISSVSFSKNGKILASGSDDKTIKLWNIENSEEIGTLKGHSFGVRVVAFSLKDNVLASGSGVEAKLWDIETKKELHSLKGNMSAVVSISFSPNGKILATGSTAGEIKLWDVESGKELITLSEYSGSTTILSLAFSPDGKILASGSGQGIIKLWNVENGKEIKNIEAHSGRIISLQFNPNGETLFSGSYDKTLKMWDVESGKELKVFKGHTYVINSISLSTNGKDLVSASWDRKIKFWDLTTGKELSTLVPLDNNNWVAITLDGRFDTNKLENPEGLHWLMPDAPLTPLSFEVFMRDYFEPNLLPRLLRCTEDENCDEEFKPVRDLTSLNRTQPLVEIKEIKKTASPDTVEVLVEAENVVSEFQKGADKKALDSGVFDLRLFRDGQLVEFSTADEDLRKTFRNFSSFDEELKVWRKANRVGLKDGKKTFSFEVKLPNDAKGKPIEFSAYAFNDDRVKSETSRKTFTLPADAKLQSKPRKAYVITFGVNKYENSAWDLEFAGNDARAMRRIVSDKLRKQKEFAEVVEIPLISDDETVDKKTVVKRDATKANVQTVFELLSGKTPTAANLKNLEKSIGTETLNKIKQSNPDDMVLMSFSSHGYADKNGIFYILPSDIGKDSARKIDSKMLSKFISSDELSLWLRDVDAQDLVMIVDACYAASAVEGKDFKPAPMGSRGLGQLAFDKGMKILTATQAANVALESGSFGHGLLTFALLRDGIDKYQADFKAKDKSINIKEWLEFGEFRVPKLYEDLASRKLKAVGKGSDIIILDGDNKQKRNNAQQTPSLFDFTRKKQELVLTSVP